MHVINPATGAIIADIPEDTREMVDQKFREALRVQRQWAATALDERIQCLSRFCDLLHAERDELAETLTSEMGKPLAQAHNELNGARSRVNYFVEHSHQYLSEEWVSRDGQTREKVTYEPLGVIANISAWNYPYLVGINVFVPALIGGNAVMYKPSEYSTLTGMHIRRLLIAAGVPAGSIQLVAGRGAAGQHLLDLPLDGYFFTGSYKTGKYIAERVAPKLVPCQLELGGKDALYVMDDIESVDKVAAAALEGVVYNNGQSCCAVERIYVQENIFDAFVQSFTTQARQLVVGDPLDPKTDVGPVSRKEQLRFLKDQIDDAVAKGARVASGGQPAQLPGYYIAPTVLVDVNHTMRVMTEESFGPVIGIQKVRDDAEAVSLMEDTPYGLTAAVYSASYERAEAIFKQVNTGTVYWNCCDRVSATLPWSGRKHSGLGSTLSYQGIRAFVQPKAYHLRTP